MTAEEIAKKHIGRYPNSQNKPTWDEIRENLSSDIEEFSKSSITDDDLFLIGQALNFYWNDASYHLTEIKNLGDMEREMYQHQLDRSKKLMVKLGFT